jgi:hypothetical protein
MEGYGYRLETHARALRATVLQFTGMLVSVGIASTKPSPGPQTAWRRRNRPPAA